MDGHNSVNGYVLNNVAEVVEKILSFVPTKSLLRMASVCHLWRNCAQRILRNQQKMTWLAASGSSRHDGHILLGALSEGLENVYLLPRTALLMVDSENFRSPECSYPHKKARWNNSEDSDFLECLKQLLPGSCDIIGIATPGVILTPVTSPGAPSEEHEIGEAGFALLLPHIEGVGVKPFNFCKHTLNTRALEQAGLVGNPDLKVVLLFGFKAYKSGASRFLHQLLETLAQTNALIVGGHVDKAFSPHRDCCPSEAYGVVGVALSGSNIQGASVLLDQGVSSEMAAEATMQRLKAAHIPERNTIGLMFACVGRGHNHYNNKQNVEAQTFNKLFPNVPLFGFFGNGEIGCDRIVKENFTLSHMDPDELQHGYTTVMTLVHLGSG